MCWAMFKRSVIVFLYFEFIGFISVFGVKMAKYDIINHARMLDRTQATAFRETAKAVARILSRILV